MSRVIAVAACGLTLAACSTSLSSLNLLKSSAATTPLRIESEPPGAEAKTSLGQGCRTPCELVVPASEEFAVTLALAGFQPQSVTVRPEEPDMTRDSQVTAPPPRLAPNPVYVELQVAPAAPPTKPAAPKKKRPVAAATRPAPVASAAPAAPATTGATPAVPPAAAPVTESAASATNYPWPSR
jgi:hypothetical protein